MSNWVKIGKCESMYVCQLNKKRDVWVDYSTRKADKTEVKNLYRDVYNCLVGTPAWNRPKANEFLNDICETVKSIATGKSRKSAYAIANLILRKLDDKYNGVDGWAQPYANSKVALTAITPDEMDELF